MEMTKEERYSWEKLDKRGKAMDISKNLIKIDPSYQRTINNNRRLGIASKFSWISFGRLVVSQREDGFFYAIDGSHRTAAAMSRSDITKIPCEVFTGLTVKQEAEKFWEINKIRRAPSSVDQYRARLTAQDPVVLGVQRILDTTGHKVESSDGKKAVRCPSVLIRCYERDPKKLEEYWPFLVRMCEYELHEYLIKGLFYLVSVMGLDLNNDKKKLILASREKLLQSVNSIAAQLGRSVGERVAAAGIAKVINNRRREKIVVDIN